jgi:hypothetical protein
LTSPVTKLLLHQPVLNGFIFSAYAEYILAY